MKTFTFEKDGRVYTRICKRVARAMFAEGVEMAICPVNLRPFTPWNPQIMISREKGGFDQIVNRFEIYNCLNRETGRYAAFYAPTADASNK